MGRVAWSGWSYFASNAAADHKHPRTSASLARRRWWTTQWWRVSTWRSTALASLRKKALRVTALRSPSSAPTRSTVEEQRVLTTVQSRTRKRTAFPVADDIKLKAVGSIRYRFEHFNYTGAFACAVVTDPRLQYDLDANVGAGKLLDLSWTNKTTDDLLKDARTWIEDTYRFEADKDTLLEQFGDLMEGSVFSMREPETAAQLKRAVDMPPWRWCKLYGRTCNVSKLFTSVIIPLMCSCAVADGVEHGNSTYKWVQTGRVTLGNEFARKLVYIIMNLRALKQRRARMTQIFDAGAFKLGWGWPPASRAANVVAEIAEVEAVQPAGRSDRARVRGVHLLAEGDHLRAAVRLHELLGRTAAARVLRRHPRDEARERVRRLLIHHHQVRQVLQAPSVQPSRFQARHAGSEGAILAPHVVTREGHRGVGARDAR